MRHSGLSPLAFSLAIILAGSAAASAQSRPGTVIITCISDDGEPVEGASVAVSGARIIRSVTARNGATRFSDLSPGEYRLVARCIGYTEEIRTVSVVEGASLVVEIRLHPLSTELPSVTVTASRAARETAAVPVPVDVIPAREIAGQHPLVLSDLLAERTGIGIVSDHGSGVQMQGMDADYTLILVDGTPVIGRVAGTLDLDRITVDNVEKVEIVKGPTSSLYGSDALAGVINVITRTHDTAFGGSVQGRYGTNGTLDAAASIHAGGRSWSGSIAAQRLGTEGYDLTPESIAPTVAPSTTYLLQPRFSFQLSPRTTYTVSSQLSHARQGDRTEIASDHDTLIADERERRDEWSITNVLRHRFDGGIAATGKIFATRFTTESTLTDGAHELDRSDFDQMLLQGEGQVEVPVASSDMLLAGAGYAHETAKADRITGDRRHQQSGFFFAQNEWIPNDAINVTAGIRFDAHQEYGSRLSPKISALYSPAPWLTLRAGSGAGFKAPTFQQLYLDFTNPTVGYSVFGATDVIAGVNRLQSDGRIKSLLMSLDAIAPLRPEHSLAFNGGIELRPFGGLTIGANLFANDVRDLIEAAPIAAKTNGQQVYSYFNLDNVITRGVDAELRCNAIDSFTIAIGYSYLDAYDVATAERVRNGDVAKVGSTGRVRAVQESEYGGLFNRSRHSGCVRIAYDNEALGLTASLRGVIRGRYGYSDLNGNGILDDASEYAPGYVLWNASLTKEIAHEFALYVTAENLLDKKDLRLPSLPGRLLSGGFTWRFQ